MEFVTGPPDVPGADFSAAWREAACSGAGAPGDARPLRSAVCTPLREGMPEPKHDGVRLEWFSDRDHLDRYERWWAEGFAAPPERVETAAAVVVAEEVVLRGDEWLRRRWLEGGEKLKHMAIARRADGLTPAVFAERWKSHAGHAPRPGGVPDLIIPEEVRGLAYVQNHPVPREKGDWTYDAVNEVYFDDLESLRRRVEWFAENLGAGDEDLVGERWFISVREEVLVGAQRSEPNCAIDHEEEHVGE